MATKLSKTSQMVYKGAANTGFKNQNKDEVFNFEGLFKLDNLQPMSENQTGSLPISFPFGCMPITLGKKGTIAYHHTNEKKNT